MKLMITVDGAGREFEPRADLGVVTIGRAPDNDIALPNEKAASRRHAMLERTVDGWKLVDQMSANGTLVNDDKVNFAYIKEGDVIRIGRTTIQVTGLAPKPVAKPAARPQPAAPVAQAAMELPRREPGRRAPVVPRRKSPLGPAIAAGAAVVFVLGVAFVISSMSGGTDPGANAPTQIAGAGNDQRTASLSGQDSAALKLAQEIVARDVPPAQKVVELDRLIESLPNRRGSAAAAQIRAMRDDATRRVLTQVEERIEADIAASQADAEKADFRTSIERLLALQGWLTNSDEGRLVGARYRDRAGKPLAELKGRNAEFVNTTYLYAIDLQERKQWQEAIDALQSLVDRAWLEADERRLYGGEIARTHQLSAREALAPAAPETPEPAPIPSVLDKVREAKENLPGENPLLPEGIRSEQQFLAALQAKLVQAASAGTLTSRRFTYAGSVAQIVGADERRVTLDVARKDRRTGEEIPMRTTLDWSRIAPADVLQLYDRTPDLTPQDRLATVIYCFDHGMMAEAARRALALYKLQNEWKPAIDNLIAQKRRMPIPEGGYVEFEGALIAPAEREAVMFERRLRDVLTRFERNAGSKDRRKQEEAERAFQEVLEMGEGAVQPAIAILDRMRQSEMTRAEAATGLMQSDANTMRKLLDALDKARAHALELIMDPVAYPYPYAPNKDEIQADVNQRVDAVRQIWTDPTRFTGQTNPEFSAILDRVRAIGERMAQLDPEQKYYSSTPEEDIAYIEAIANEKLSIQNYAPPEDKSRKALIALNRQIMQYNEEFPTGPGNTDGDGRAQVRITNEYRIMFGRVALKLNDKLFWAAWHHSKYCVEHNGGQIAHNVPGAPRGETPGDRMRYEGYSGGGGENIHVNSAGPTALSSHQAWCQSSGHHRNILNPGWRVLGSGKFRNIWTQNFGARDEGEGNSVSRGGE